MEKKQTINLREIVIDMLYAIIEEGNYSHVIIRNVLDKYNYLDAKEKAFIKRVTQGTLERLIQIDYCLEQFSKISVRKMKPYIRCLMRMSACQILFMDHIPDSAVCNEAVKLASKRGFSGLKGFVNGVLRSLCTKKSEIVYPDLQKDPVRYYSVMYSMPEWIVKMWCDAYPSIQVENMLKALLMEQPVTVRIREDLEPKQREELSKDWQKHPYLPYAFTLPHVEGVASLPAFSQGLFAVQDVSSMLVCEIADIQKGDIILDACAAPGGKTLHASAKLNKTGQVIARDISENRLTQLRESVERLGCHNVTIQCQDATQIDETLIGKADIVLADVPCSGLGVIGRKRDIKYKASEDKLPELYALQRQILSVLQNYVRIGGTMVISTCTINKEENENLLSWFLSQYPFEMQCLDTNLPKILQDDHTREGYLMLLPGTHMSDGFFMAKLKRKG